MSDKRQYILAEVKNVSIALDLVVPLLEKPLLDTYNRIALGTLLQNIYMGIENTLRCQLQEMGCNISKTENWHKDLLQDAYARQLVEAAEYPVFRKLLLYRHRHVHGYGDMLDEEKLRDLAIPVPSVVRNYLQRIAESYH